MGNHIAAIFSSQSEKRHDEYDIPATQNAANEALDCSRKPNGHIPRGFEDSSDEPTVEAVPAHCTIQPQGKASDRCFWMTLFAFFSAFDVILFALLISVSVQVSRRRSASDTPEMPEGPRELSEDSAFCLPCLEVYMTELEVLQNRYRVSQRRDGKNQTLLCCAESHDDLRTFIGRMYVRVHYPSDRAKGLVPVAVPNDTTSDGQPLNRVSPHLVLFHDTSKPATETVNGTHSVPLKMPESGAEYNSTSAIFHNGSIKVVHAGLYYIYSHVPFKSVLPASSLTQYVHRVRNDGSETILLQDSVFPCDVKTKSCLHSFVGGMFLLEEEDRISLTVSDHTCVEKEQEMRFGVQRV